jgi:selenide, water dikinase
MDDIKLTSMSKFAGCGAKLGPGILDKALCGLTQPHYPNLLVDYTTSDDAGVYKLTEDLALVNTLDFFPPIVDDPFAFGQIATANALSDIYAMGGIPITAMSIVGFPLDKLDISVLRKITEGSLERLKEAGVALVGGHSIQDGELKFGLSVSGTIHPDKILKNNSPVPGTVAILTKPLGTGTINTALKKGIATKNSIDESMLSMIKLNKQAAEIISKYRVYSCTDVTGFGLIGHSCETIIGTGCDLIIDFNSLELLPGTLEYIEMGAVPGGTKKNMEFRSSYIRNFNELPDYVKYTVFDPQTSGGLLFTVDKDNYTKVLADLISNGVSAYVVGEIVKGSEKIEIKL